MKAEALSKMLGGRKIGSGWLACCPAHDDQTPSLSINDGTDGKVLVHCFAGCEQRRIIQELRARGLLRQIYQDPPSCPTYRVYEEVTSDKPNDGRTKAAISIWQSSVNAEGTLAELYLGSRGLYLPIASAIRFHPALKHPSGDRWPAMVALVTHGIDGTPVAVHRTYLASDGQSKAPVNPQKMMFGPCGGGVVRLGAPGNHLMVGEGIETCLSAMQATGHSAWAALSSSGLRSLNLPNHVRDVIVLADGDDAGEAAARDCAHRWKLEGRRIRIARPPRGFDFNDILPGRTLRTGESVR